MGKTKKPILRNMGGCLKGCLPATILSPISISLEALMEVFMEHYRREKKLALEDLRDYCSDDTAVWLEFLGVEPDE